MGPPQTQHTSFEVKSPSSKEPQLKLLYAEQPSPHELVAPLSWSVHCPAVGGEAGDGPELPPPQTRHTSFEVKSSSSYQP